MIGSIQVYRKMSEIAKRAAVGVHFSLGASLIGRINSRQSIAKPTFVGCTLSQRRLALPRVDAVSTAVSKFAPKLKCTQRLKPYFFSKTCL
jgi:hypothetical protein